MSAGVERVAHRTEHLAAGRDHRFAGVALERMTERVVGGDEEPGLAAARHHRFGGGVRGGIGVVSPLNAGRRAILAGDVGRAGAGDQKRLVALARDIHDRQRHGGIDAFGDHIDVLGVDPFAHDGAGDVGFVLMIAGNDLDLASGHAAADLLGRHLRGDHRARSVTVGILAAHIGDDADAQHVVLCASRRRADRDRENDGARPQLCDFHLSPPFRSITRPVWRFRSPHHFCRELVMRTSEPKPHQIDTLLVSFDSEVRKRGCRIMMRTSESGH